MFLSFLAFAYTIELANVNVNPQEAAAKILTIISGVLGKKYTVSEFIKALELPAEETQFILSNITYYANYLKIDANLGSLVELDDNYRILIKGVERLLFSNNNKKVTYGKLALAFLGGSISTKLPYINGDEIDLGGFDAEFSIGLSAIKDLLGAFSDLDKYFDMLEKDIIPLVDSLFKALNMNKCSLLNLYNQIIDGGWNFHSLLKDNLQLDLSNIYDHICLVLHVFEGSHYSEQITPKYIHEKFISKDSSKLTHLFEIYQKFSQVDSTKFEASLLWDGLFTGIDYLKDLYFYVKDTLLGVNFKNLFQYHIDSLNGLRKVPIATTCTNLIAFLDLFTNIESDPSKVVYQLFDNPFYHNATIFIKNKLKPFFQEFSTNTKNLIELVSKHFEVPVEEVTFYINLIKNCTSNKVGVLDIFQGFAIFLKNQTLIDISNYINEARAIAPNYDLNYNLKQIFNLIQEKYHDEKSLQYYNLIVNTIKEFANPEKSIGQLSLVSFINHTKDFNDSTIAYGQKRAEQLLTNTTKIQLNEGIVNFLKEAIPYIDGFRTKSVKQYLKEIGKTAEVEEVTKSGEVILNYVYPFIINISKTFKVELLTKYVLDDVLKLQEVGKLLKDTDFNLKEALNLYYNNLGDILDIISPVVVELSNQSPIMQILKAIPVDFINIEESFKQFINTKVLSVYHGSQCLIDSGDKATDIKLRASELVPVYRIFDASYALSAFNNPSIADEIELCQFGLALNYDLSFVKLITYTINLLDKTSCRNFIENVLNYLTFDGAFWDQWIGRAHVAFDSAANQKDIDFSLPDDKETRDPDPEYKPATEECNFEVVHYTNDNVIQRIMRKVASALGLKYGDKNDNNKIYIIIGSVASAFVVVIAVIVIAVIRRKKNNEEQFEEINNNSLLANQDNEQKLV
ncbi:hypothetical protein GPJ56_000480 [Histomonas meleagridis]|uniref:uncharacterized protein n=1 Tax=Histomonas meleagridis TaxID=135588 RepID=UPI0035593E66|nr:hypothetical protein GPJ56_000480 [Histomonas meleagridis]KAH0796481.1 hypothetical protein GO595_010374 [Histomonas meleagridis]